MLRLNKSGMLHLISIALLLLLTVSVFYAGRNGPWLFDDKHNIVNLQNLQPEFIDQNPLWRGAQVNDQWRSRSLARLSFAFTVKTCGATTTCFKITNIGLQALTAFAVYIFCLQLLAYISPSGVLKEKYSSHIIGFSVAALWAIHPIQVSTVLYAVQRMTILSTLFCVCTLIFYLYWRKEVLLPSGKLALLAAILAAICAFQCKENAVVLPLLIMCIEFFIIRAEPAPDQKKYFYFSGVAVIVLLAIIGFQLLGSSGFFEAYINRPFSPWERLLTESRIIWLYLYWILLPQTSHYTLFHDDLVISQSILQPLSTLFSIVSIILVSLILFVKRKKYPLLAFSWFWFLCAHAVESTFLNLELVFEHRNHLPLIGLLFGLVLAITQLLAKQRLIIFVLPVVILAYCGAITFEKSKHWRSDGSMLVYESQFHPRSVRLNYKIAFLWLQLAATKGLAEEEKTYYLLSAEEAFKKAAIANNYSVHGYIGLLYMQGQKLLEKPVDDEYWQALNLRLENAPMSADVANLLHLLSTCYLNSVCQFSQVELENAYSVYLSRNISHEARHNAKAALTKLLGKL